MGHSRGTPTSQRAWEALGTGKKEQNHRRIKQVQTTASPAPAGGTTHPAGVAEPPPAVTLLQVRRIPLSQLLTKLQQMLPQLKTSPFSQHLTKLQQIPPQHRMLKV